MESRLRYSILQTLEVDQAFCYQWIQNKQTPWPITNEFK